MHKRKKAQISDTLSWVVATIIIVLILGVPVFLVGNGMINTNKINFERVQDTLATKSISGYLLKESSLIVEELKEGKLPSKKDTETDTEKRLSLFLYSLGRNENVEGWNLRIFTPLEESSSSWWDQLFSSDKKLYTKISYDVLVKEGLFPNIFYIGGYSENGFLIFKFWKERQGK